MTLRRKVASWSAALIVVLLVAADLLLANAASGARAERSARTDAMKAARSLVPVLLSYDHSSLQADLARSRATTTGRFRSDFDKLVTSVVQPAAASHQVTTHAVVVGAGVVSATSNRVVVLVFVTQTSASSAHTSPVITGSRVEVRMERTAGGWLIAGLDPV